MRTQDQHPIRLAATTLILVWVVNSGGFGPAAESLAAEAPAPATYRVRTGDSLSLIAARFGTTVSGLKRDNSLQRDIIHIGQRLRISKPFHRKTPRRPWQCPVRHPGALLRPFGPYKAGGILMPRTGAELAAPAGTQLYCPATGIVRHSGALEGMGHLLIIEHADHFATVLAPCDPNTVVVEVGQAVLAGDPLARTAPPTDPQAPAYVHLELRHNDKAITPERLICR